MAGVPCRSNLHAAELIVEVAEGQSVVKVDPLKMPATAGIAWLFTKHF